MKEEKIIAYKGFDKNLKCRDFQYDIGKSYNHDGDVEARQSGFHSCENPFDVLSYYGICDSRFAEVEVFGKLSRHREDSKISSDSITIKKELSLSEFIKNAIKYIIDLTKISNDDLAKIGSSGDWEQISSSGYGAQIGSSGYRAQIGSSADMAQIGSSGDEAKIGSSGDMAQIGSSGDEAKIGSSGDEAKIGSSGYGAKIGSSGYGAKIEASGEKSIVSSAGFNTLFKIGKNCCAAIPYNDGERTRFAIAYTGENVKENVWYKVNEKGEFVEET